MPNAFGDFYKDKTVLVTGHTGFKGPWLCMWLNMLGAKKVIGFALESPMEPSGFDVCNIEDHVTHVHGDVRHYDHLFETMQEHQPDIIFHLAAQSLVPYSIEHPLETLEINMMGTANMLNAALHTDSVKAVISITSDKCYRNENWIWGYRETDAMGGHDPYSASKACAEMVIGTYQSREFQAAKGRKKYLPIASARAGNVVGGGDWSAKRLVPDTIRAIAAGEKMLLRSPNATRPWQHVLEPLSGYLWLGANIANNPDLFASGWNFGPVDQGIYPAKEVVEKLIAFWPSPETEVEVAENGAPTEAVLLALDCSKARGYLNWTGTWLIDDTIATTSTWFSHFYNNKQTDMYEFTLSQIQSYTQDALDKGQAWAHGQLLESK